MALAGVHRHRPWATPDLERRVRDLVRPLGLRASPASPPAPPAPAPTPSPTPSPGPSPGSSPALARASSSASALPLSALQLHEMAARQARLDAALRGALQGDADLQEVRARRRQLEERQRELESELEVQRQVLQGSALLGLAPDSGTEAGAGTCATCQRVAQRERQLRLQEQQLQRLRAQTAEEQRQLQAHRAALDWERRNHAPGTAPAPAPAPAPGSAPAAAHQGDAEFSWLGLLCCCC